MMVRTTKQIIIQEQYLPDSEEWVCLVDLKKQIPAVLNETLEGYSIGAQILSRQNIRELNKIFNDKLNELCNSSEQKKCTCPKPIEEYIPFPEDKIICGRCGGAL